jgi:hypothetical protein
MFSAPQIAKALRETAAGDITDEVLQTPASSVATETTQKPNVICWSC